MPSAFPTRPVQPWWQDLPGIEQGWVLFSDLLRYMSTARPMWRLDAVAGVAEPALAHIDMTRHGGDRILGAFEIEGLTVIPLEDPNDGYRSLCPKVKVVPGLALSHRLPRLAVVARAVQHGEQGRLEARVDESWGGGDGGLMELISLDTQEMVLLVGTRVDDYYYPCAMLRWEPEAMTRAFVQAEDRLLREEIGSGSAQPRRVRL